MKTGVRDVISALVDVTVGIGKMTTDHHQHEKRHGRTLDKNRFSCAMFRITPEELRREKPLLLYEMTFRYCIKCASEHWFLGERIENPVPDFNPNDYWTWQLEEMGFFNKGHDSNRP